MRSQLSALRSMVFWLAVAFLIIVLLTTWVVTRSFHDTVKILLPGTATSLLAVIVIYLYQNSLGKEPQGIFREEEISRLAAELSELLQKHFRQKVTFQLYERWEEIDWKPLFQASQHVTIIVSYMDDWLSNNKSTLLSFFSRGGQMRIFLPKPKSEIARRVQERFPKQSIAQINEKIRSTADILEGIRETSNSAASGLEVWWSTIFCLHCMIVFDQKVLLLSPYDHVRGIQVDAPAFLADLHEHKGLAAWVSKEVKGFESASLRASEAPKA